VKYIFEKLMPDCRHVFVNCVGGWWRMMMLSLKKTLQVIDSGFSTTVCIVTGCIDLSSCPTLGSVSTWSGKPSQCITSRPAQLSLSSLPGM